MWSVHVEGACVLKRRWCWKSMWRAVLEEHVARSSRSESVRARGVAEERGGEWWSAGQSRGKPRVEGAWWQRPLLHCQGLFCPPSLAADEKCLKRKLGVRAFFFWPDLWKGWLVGFLFFWQFQVRGAIAWLHWRSALQHRMRIFSGVARVLAAFYKLPAGFIVFRAVSAGGSGFCEALARFGGVERVFSVVRGVLASCRRI